MTISPKHIKHEIFQRRAHYISEGLPWPIIQRKLKDEFEGHSELLKEVWQETTKAGARTRAKKRGHPVAVPTTQTVVAEPARYVQLEFDFGQ